jgi:Mrp family chromosome partitioning ATPase
MADESCTECERSDCSAKNQKPGETPEQFAERQEIMQRMCRIKRKLIVLSGKGGVGKSTVAVNLAVSLALKGKSVGLLDVDIHGPNVPKMLGVGTQNLRTQSNTIYPLEVGNGLRVISIGFLVPSEDEAVVWRGPMKMIVIKQFLKDVEWGDLDYLIVDSPPGTGDEPLSVCQLIEGLDGAIVITTPQDLALSDVRRSIRFCRLLKVPVIGVIENMSWFVCPHCGQRTDLFKSGGGRKMADLVGVPFLGEVPFDPGIVRASDDGRPYIRSFSQSEAAKAFEKIVQIVNEKMERI